MAGAAAATSVAQLSGSLYLQRRVWKSRTKWVNKPNISISTFSQSIQRNSNSNSNSNSSNSKSGNGKSQKYWPPQSMQSQMNETAPTVSVFTGRTAKQTLRTFKTVLSSNAAVLLRSFSLMGCWGIATSVCARISNPAVAAHQILLSIFMLFSLLGEAPAIAAQVLIARLLAVGEKKQARLLTGRLFRISLATGLFASLGTYLTSTATLQLFSGPGNELVRSEIARAMHISISMQPLVALTLVTEGLITGAGAFRHYAVSTVIASGLVSASLLKAIKQGGTVALSICDVWNHISALFIIRLTCHIFKLLLTLRGENIVIDSDDTD